jgi:hypothetical protein
MSTSFGEIRFRAKKLPHGAGVDFDVLNGIINDRLQEIVRHYNWSRLLEADATLSLVVLYETGALSVTSGSNAVTGSGTTFTSQMTGRRIRISGRQEFYTFTYVSATSGTLDRNYEGDTDTDLSYKIFKNVYVLASDVGQLLSVKDLESGRVLEKKSLDWLDRLDPSRVKYGEPVFYAPTEDASSIQQIELYPIPENAEGLSYRYKPIVVRITATSTNIPDWISIECLFAGIEADLYQLQKDLVMSQAKEARFKDLLREMVREDSNRKPSEQMQMADRFTAHRAERQLNTTVSPGRSNMLQSIFEEV